MRLMGSASRTRRLGPNGWGALVLIGLALIIVLFFVKTRALEARTYVKKLEHNLEIEQAEVRMISAEIAHLESPDRLKKLARDHLGLRPVQSEQVLTMEQASAQLQKPHLQKNMQKTNKQGGGAK